MRLDHFVTSSFDVSSDMIGDEMWEDYIIKIPHFFHFSVGRI